MSRSDIDELVSLIIGDILKEDDPAARFAMLSEKLELMDRVVTRIADERARCAADLNAAGASFAGVAAGLAIGTRSRAQQLVERGRSLPGLIFAFRDQTGEFHGDVDLMNEGQHESAQMQFEPEDRALTFAGQLLTVYFGPVDESTVLPSIYTFTSVNTTSGTVRRIRPTQAVHKLLFQATG